MLLPVFDGGLPVAAVGRRAGRCPRQKVGRRRRRPPVAARRRAVAVAAVEAQPAVRVLDRSSTGPAKMMRKGSRGITYFFGKSKRAPKFVYFGSETKERQRRKERIARGHESVEGCAESREEEKKRKERVAGGGGKPGGKGEGEWIRLRIPHGRVSPPPSLPSLVATSFRLLRSHLQGMG